MVLRLLKYGLSRRYPGTADISVTPDLKVRYDVVNIGAGGHGLACARYLTKHPGITDVAVLDKGWLAGGDTARNTTTIRSNYITPQRIAFYKEGVALYERMSGELDFNVMFSQRGQLTLAHSEATLRAFHLRAETGRFMSVNVEVVDQQGVERLCPYLNMDFAGALEVLGGLSRSERVGSLDRAPPCRADLRVRGGRPRRGLPGPEERRARGARHVRRPLANPGPEHRPGLVPCERCPGPRAGDGPPAQRPRDTRHRGALGLRRSRQPEAGGLTMPAARTFPLQADGAASDRIPLLGDRDGLDITDQTAWARFGIKGSDCADWLRGAGIDLPELNRLTEAAGLVVMLLEGNDMGARARAPEAVAALRNQWDAAGPKGHSSWREEAWAWLHLAGPALDEALARCCAVDLRSTVQPAGRIAQTTFAHVDAVVVHWNDGADILFDIAATAFVLGTLRQDKDGA